MLPDRSILIGQKLVEIPKFKNSNETFWVIFKQCENGFGSLDREKDLSLDHFGFMIRAYFFWVVGLRTFLSSLDDVDSPISF